MAAVRKTIQRVDAALPILSARSIEEQMAPLTAQDRTTAQLAVVFGCVALALAAIGLYGVLSYGIARRTGEIAIRIALGAQPGRVISMILRETIGLVGAGLALGGGLAYAAVALDRQPALRRRSAGSAHAGIGDRAAAAGGAQRGVPAGAAGVEAGSDGGAASGVKYGTRWRRTLLPGGENLQDVDGPRLVVWFRHQLDLLALEPPQRVGVVHLPDFLVLGDQDHPRPVSNPD